MNAFISTTWVVITCYKDDCGCSWAMPAAWDNDRRNDHKEFYCPNGHGQSYMVQSKEEKERQRAQRAEQENARLHDEISRHRETAKHHERRASTFKGHCTRIKKKVGVGKCPCCPEPVTFKNLRRHMLKLHPDWQPDAEPEINAKATAKAS